MSTCVLGRRTGKKGRRTGLAVGLGQPSPGSADSWGDGGSCRGVSLAGCVTGGLAVIRVRHACAAQRGTAQRVCQPVRHMKTPPMLTIVPCMVNMSAQSYKNSYVLALSRWDVGA